MSEAQEQKLLIEWCELQKCKYPELKLIFHIPNEGKRSFKTGMELKRQGLKSGVPDLFLPVARNGFHGLWIEMKFGKNRLSKTQKDWYWALIEEGYQVNVCYSADEGIEVIKKYLSI